MFTFFLHPHGGKGKRRSVSIQSCLCDPLMLGELAGRFSNIYKDVLG